MNLKSIPLKSVQIEPISINTLILTVSLFIILFGNVAFFSNVLNTYSAGPENILFLLSLAIFVWLVTMILISMFSFRISIKPILIIILMISSVASYFMDNYNIVIDENMIDNIVKTDIHESLDLLSSRMFLYVVFMGVIPSLFIYRMKIKHVSFKRELLSKIKFLSICIISATLCLFIFSPHYASFFREHKPLRFYANPAYYLYSSTKYINSLIPQDIKKFSQIGKDARISLADKDRELVIFVVGETARADRFSLNGYAKKTNPNLEKEKVISFNNFWACGTSTAISVPCMFSFDSHTQFNKQDATNTDNLLDVLNRAGVHTLWLDNNSDSKGVATRIPYFDYKTPETNPVCDVECRDIGMLSKLQDYINSHEEGDIFIVLHQMGNHGPAYYKRYPAEFEKFTPVCKTNKLESCTKEQLDNTYDNVILYTDHFLAETIKLLKNNNDTFESALIYASDHGESLGEKRVYLHGLPYFIAPDEQKRVPMIMWFSENFNTQHINFDKLYDSTSNQLNHDYISHTVLSLFEINTSIHDKNYSLL